MDSEKNPTRKSVGSLRWAENSQLSSPTPSNQEKCENKNVHTDEVSIDSSLLSNDNIKDNQGQFCMDVQAFEKSLKEKRDHKFREQSPLIEIRLRETAAGSPREYDSPLSKIKIHHFKTESDVHRNVEENLTPSTSDEVDYVQSAQRRVKRVITYEKVLKTKSIREISCPVTYTTKETIQSQSPTVQRTIDCSIDGISSTELIAGADDSAYHSHRVRIASSGTPTTISISSSSNSLQHDFMSDENVYAQRTPSREKLVVECAGSDSPHFDGYENRSSVDSTRGVYAEDTATVQPERPGNWFVSPVTGGNENVCRHFDPCKSSVESDGISQAWYNDYKTQTFQVDRPHKMDFKRSNSQYDNHIRQIRGIL